MKEKLTFAASQRAGCEDEGSPDSQLLNFKYFSTILLTIVFFKFQLPELISISQYARNMSTEATPTECDQTCNVDFATDDDVPEIIDFLKTYFFKVIVLSISLHFTIYTNKKKYFRMNL